MKTTFAASKCPHLMWQKILCSCFIITAGQLCAQHELMTFSQSIKAASEKSPLLIPFQLDTSIARADVITAELRPNLKLNNQSLFVSNPSNFQPNTHWGSSKNTQIWWQLTKNFELPSQRNSRIELAKRNVDYSFSNYREISRNVFREVSFQWLEVWSIQKQVELYRLALNNADSLTLINELRFKNQAITETELLRTRLVSDQYKAQLESAQLELKNAALRLGFITGNQSVSGVDTTGFDALGTFTSVDSLLNFGLNKRSDIQALNSMISVSEANVSYQKAMARPTPELGVIYNPQNTIPYIGLYGTIELPVFSRNQGEIQKSLIQKKQAEELLEAGKDQVSTDIAITYQSYRMYAQKLIDYESQLQLADQILDNVKYSYLRGGTTIIDYLEAQRNWLDVQQRYFETYRNYKETGVELLFISGKIIELGL